METAKERFKLIGEIAFTAIMVVIGSVMFFNMNNMYRQESRKWAIAERMAAVAGTDRDRAADELRAAIQDLNLSPERVVTVHSRVGVDLTDTNLSDAVLTAFERNAAFLGSVDDSPGRYVEKFDKKIHKFLWIRTLSK